MHRHSQESEKSPDTKPAESFHGKKGAARRQWPSSEVEGRTPQEGTEPEARELGAGVERSLSGGWQGTCPKDRSVLGPLDAR